MYERNVKGAERKRQDFGIKRDSRPDIKQKQMSAGVFFESGAAEHVSGGPAQGRAGIAESDRAP